MSKTYKKQPDAIWAVIRASYLAGMTARDCAQRFGVSESAIAWRARQQGWRKCDAQVPPVPPETREGALADPRSAARAAFQAAALAMTEGRLHESQALMKLAEAMSRLDVAPPPEEAKALTGEDRDKLQAKVFGLIEARARDLVGHVARGGDWYTGGDGLPAPQFAIDRDGRIVATANVEGACFDGVKPDWGEALG
ncbi:MAG: hypothetical protein ACXW3D_10895 [Caulobacteraceae bacterium]